MSVRGWWSVAVLIGHANSSFVSSLCLCVLGLDPIVNLANIDIDAPAWGTLTPRLARSPLFMQMAAVARVARTWQEA